MSLAPLQRGNSWMRGPSPRMTNNGMGVVLPYAIALPLVGEGREGAIDQPCKFSPNALDHAFEILQHFGVPAANDGEALLLEPSRAPCVGSLLDRVLAAIHFNDEALSKQRKST